MAAVNWVSIELADNGDLAITYQVDKDQSEFVREVKTIIINREKLSEWEHAAYYYMELMEDVDEFLGWVDKYRRGVV